MNQINNEDQISCLVDYGTIYAKRDMVRILRDLDKVRYVDMLNNVVASEGEGYVIEVFSNGFDSTLIFNNRLHINVNGFDYLEIKTNPNKEVALISGHRTIRLRPVSNSTSNVSSIEEEIDEQRIAIASQLACDNDEDLNFFGD